MFGFFKNKKVEILAISDGEIIELASVKDEVFSQKLAGDGVAIIPSSSDILAPVGGTISKIFPTNHAFIVTTKSGLEVMVHIGLDTVELRGEGFKVLHSEGSIVKAKTPIINVDFDYLRSKGKDIVTPILINSEKKSISIKFVKAGMVKGGDIIMEV